MGNASKAMACTGSSVVTAQAARFSASAPATALAVRERNCLRSNIVFTSVASWRPNDEHDAEADVRIVSDTEEAAGRPAVRHVEIVAAAANDFPSHRIGGRTLRIGHRTTRQIAKPILGPLPDVALCVVQSPRIGKLLPDWVKGKRGREPAVENKPRIIRQVRVVRIISIAEPRRRSGACGALPFCLGWKAILASGRNASRGQFPLRQLPAVIRRVEPAHARNRTAEIAGKEAWICVHDGKVFV